MSFLNWDNSLSIGVKKIDEEHQKLVSILNNLHDAMKMGKEKDTLNNVFNDLIQYTKIHFEFEEKIMLQKKYDKILYHKVEHNKIIKEANDLQKKFKSGQLNITIDLLNFLKVWIVDHIQKTDKEFGNYLNSLGIK